MAPVRAKGGAYCTHLPGSTRVCFVHTPLTSQIFPGGVESFSTPVLPELRKQGLMKPEDVVLVGNGLW